MQDQQPWWQTGVIYQIYPRSFMDASGDGTGDLAGITARLEYLQWLGVDALWLSPIYPSPMADFGYDIADYTGVDPLFGTLAHFDQLLAEAHRRSLKVILDLVPNHTSDDHPWFRESRSSRDNAKRNWYIWRDARADGSLPNNWTTYFGGEAWTLDQLTGQYYLHLFHEKQPDLNWRNPEVRAAMLEVMRFWLARGVDGFRVDVMWLMIKDAELRDNLPNPQWQPGDDPTTRQNPIYSSDQPETHEIVRAMRALCDEFGQRVLIGEVYLPVPRLMSYYGTHNDEAHLPFNFQLIDLPWRAEVIQRAAAEYEAALPVGCWPNWVLGNHDRSRIASRAGADQARVAQMLLLTLRGTPTCYYGDEIGMHDVAIAPERALDPVEHQSPGHGRDPERTPMQWDSSPNSGFSPAEPWLPLADDYSQSNVAAERADPRSLLSLVHRLLALRRQRSALTVGRYRQVDLPVEGVLAFGRVTEEERLLVLLNFTAEEKALDLAGQGLKGRVLLSTHLDRDQGLDASGLGLRANEGLILALA
jgi:alpha-glucosidase